MTSLVVRKEVHGGIEVVKLERVRVICPACGQQVEAVASDGRVKVTSDVNSGHQSFHAASNPA